MKPKSQYSPIKWVGGKNKLIPQIMCYFDYSFIKSGTIERYIEPFFGGGSFFFYLSSIFKIKEQFISDLNPEIIIFFNALKYSVDEFLKQLNLLFTMYVNMETLQDKRVLYFTIREKYNRQLLEGFDFNTYTIETIYRSAMMYFLNKFGFMGLYRKNAKGEFNVAYWNRYFSKDKVATDAVSNYVDEKRIRTCSANLQVCNKLITQDFMCTKYLINSDSLVFIDPPYLEIKDSINNFKSYGNSQVFDISQQLALGDYYSYQSNTGQYVLQTNSDSMEFINDHYSRFNIYALRSKQSIHHVSNSKIKDLVEVLITNKIPSVGNIFTTFANLTN